jgi:hypothetical protein
MLDTCKVVHLTAYGRIQLFHLPVCMIFSDKSYAAKAGLRIGEYAMDEHTHLEDGLS